MSNFSQDQREAVVDLLVLATSSDQKFTIIESEATEEILMGLTWTSVIRRGLFLQQSHARARATSSLQARSVYLQSLCRRIAQNNVAQEDANTNTEVVLDLVLEALVSDGFVTLEDDWFVALRAVFQAFNQPGDQNTALVVA